MSNDELIHLLDEDAAAPAAQRLHWTVVIIDDDAEVHAATSLALRRVELLGRPLQLVHLRSGSEVRAQLPGVPDPAVILLDVVMETEDAGLRLVEFIRRGCGLLDTRIILRTGQPGQAPELEVFEHYDINDYRTKSELTRTRLITAISGGIRSYEQIRTIAEGRRGLELIVRSAPDLLQQNALSRFAEGVLTQLAALLRVPLDGIVCAQRGSPLDHSDGRLFVVGAAGRLASAVLQPLDEVEDPTVAALIVRAMEQRQHLIEAQASVLYLHSGGRDGAVYVASGRDMQGVDRQLLEVFAANIAACYSNLRRFEEINHVAFHDPLSGLGNRARLLHDLDDLCDQGGDHLLALLDLRDFSEINDGLGEDLGNQLLAAIGRRLRDRFGQRCRLARIGPDVFAIAGPRSELEDSRLLGLLDAPFSVAGQSLSMRACFGLCTLGEESASELLKQANLALNRAKRGGEPLARYEAGMAQASRDRLIIIQQLREDMARDLLQAWFQPQIELASGRVLCIEALLRWPAAHGGFVQPPNIFVPLAEQAGLIVELGYLVLRQSLAALQALAGLPQAPERVAVNISVAQLHQPDFLSRIEHTIRASGLPTSAIELEITESIAMDEPQVVARTLQSLRELGVKVAIDDFGTGYSSLNQLRHLPFDSLKIDQSFVREIDTGQGAMFVETIMTLAQRLGVATTAEGVETDSQLDCLRRLGCPVVQGYRFAKPMPLDTLAQWLRDYRPQPG